MEADVVVEIFNKIDELIATHKMFTCYDITRLIRNDGNAVEHEDVRTIVHGLYATRAGFADVYMRYSAIPLVSHPGVAAEVYGPGNCKPYNYDPEALNPNRTITLPLQTATVSSPLGPVAIRKTTQVKSRPEYMTLSVGRRGRLNIPSRLTKAAHIKPRQTVYVARRANGQDGFVILQKAPKSGWCRPYVVDHHGNLRLSNTLLKKCGVGGAKTFTCRTTDNSLGIVGVSK